MTSLDIKRLLTQAVYWLFGLFTIPFMIYYYNISYTITIAVVHIMHIFLLMYTLRQQRKLSTMNEMHKIYKKNQAQLHLKENELNSLFDSDKSYLWTINLSEKTFIPSQGFENVYGYSREEFLANYELWKDRVIPEDLPIAEEHYSTLKSGSPSNKAFRFKNSAGEMRWLDAWGTPIFDEDNVVTHLTGVAYDITEKKRIEEQLYYNATHDHLTGLPNRKKLKDYWEEELSKSDSTTQSFAVLFLDLDRFKLVNDSQGHAIGDELLIQIGRRLNAFVEDRGMVSRHGGDEFIIIVKYQNKEEFMPFLNGILDVFKIPFDINNEEIRGFSSVGISIYPKDDTTIEGLIGQADRAMYRAKSQGKNTYCFANPLLEEAETRKNSIELHLKRALELKEFELYYQPIVDLKTGNFIATEALIRWHSPRFGIVMPLEFIPIAESQGLINEIGLWVLDEATKQKKRWQDKGIDIGISVNVSNTQFDDDDFSQKVSDILTKNQMKAENLTIEITESTLQNTEIVSKTIQRLRSMGIQIAIDDFGTGYSSLSVLNSLPIDTIKIDRSFIFDILENENNAQLVNTIISLGETLKCKVVAEGIEDPDQVTFLNELGCSYGQGYLYSRPKKSDAIEKLLLQQQVYNKKSR